MRNVLWIVWAVLGAGNAVAQRSDLGLMLGAFQPRDRMSGNARLEIGAGMSLYANYGLRVMDGEKAALYVEVPFVATPQHKISSAVGSATRDVATIYLTPGLRLKLAPGRRIAPYIAGGAGWALFEQSTTRLDGRPNEAPRLLSRGAVNFGGGVDVRVWRFVSARGEVRDFVSGNPAFQVPVRGGAQHSLLVAGGFALRF